jgi:rhodanese-related sulfurtransferase
MSREGISVIGVPFLLLAAVLLSSYASAAEPPRITTEELQQRLGDPGIVVVDVRGGWDWSRSDRKISGAVREDPKEVGAWAKRYPKDKAIVLYCA